MMFMSTDSESTHKLISIRKFSWPLLIFMSNCLLTSLMTRVLHGLQLTANITFSLLHRQASEVERGADEEVARGEKLPQTHDVFGIELTTSSFSRTLTKRSSVLVSRLWMDSLRAAGTSRWGWKQPIVETRAERGGERRICAYELYWLLFRSESQIVTNFGYYFGLLVTILNGVTNIYPISI